MEQPEWIAELGVWGQIAAQRLEWTLSLEMDDDQLGEPVGHIKALVRRVKGFKIEVFANEHPPPHFRVKAGGETANYRIDDCTQLNGGLRKHYRTIRNWHAENRHELIDAWNSNRPSDCPVGPFRAA